MMPTYMTPVRKDEVYCSPGCGFGCNYSAHEQAVHEADELAVSMGDGWEPNVWENAGWHYEVKKGCARIAANRQGSALTGGWTVRNYSAWLRSGNQLFIEDAEDPHDALGYAVQAARTSIAKMQDDLNALINT